MPQPPTILPVIIELISSESTSNTGCVAETDAVLTLLLRSFDGHIYTMPLTKSAVRDVLLALHGAAHGASNTVIPLEFGSAENERFILPLTADAASDVMLALEGRSPNFVSERDTGSTKRH